LKISSAAENPWGVSKSARVEWAKGMDIPAFNPEIAEEGYLLWVGCACSADENNTRTAKAVVNLLKAAKIPFGILGKKETCCGDPARRIGNEDLFQMEAEQNISTFNDMGVKRIITLCPHGYHIFKNEYPDFGGTYEVHHYTEFLNSIMDKFEFKKGSSPQPLTYQDPCYLGRYNDIYEAPRNMIQKVGGNLSEMTHHRDLSLCCGGGGGHAFMEEEKEQRINHFRIDEAAQTGCPTVLTACPLCLIMLTDAIKEKNITENLSAMDIAVWFEEHVENIDSGSNNTDG